MLTSLPSVDFVKLQHVLGGLYIWELLNGLEFDRRLLRRDRRHSALAKWVRASQCDRLHDVIPKYCQVFLACRYIPLIGFIIQFIGYNAALEVGYTFALELRCSTELNLTAQEHLQGVSLLHIPWP